MKQRQPNLIDTQPIVIKNVKNSRYPFPCLKVYEARETIPGVESGFVFHVFQSSKLIMILIFLKWLNNYLKIQTIHTSKTSSIYYLKVIV